MPKRVVLYLVLAAILVLLALFIGQDHFAFAKRGAFVLQLGNEILAKFGVRILGSDAFFNLPAAGIQPVCDGQIECAHGLLASPPPAVQELLTGVPVYGIDHQGETVTPTALALLKAWNVEFGNWPKITITRTIRAYGHKLITGVPNGAVFCLGEAHSMNTDTHLPAD